MTKILSFFTGSWQGTLAAAAIVALLTAGATFYLTSLRYRLTIAQMERDKASDGLAAANFALTQFMADADTIHTAATSFGGIRDDLNAQLATISRDFSSATKAHPLPVDCKPDPVRLRALSSAIAATNSAAGLGPVASVPGHP